MGKMKDALVKLAKKIANRDLTENEKDSMSNVIGTIAEEYQEGGGGGTTVVANPELVGGEPNLSALQIGADKYKVPSGGGSGNPYLINYDEFANYIIGKHLSVDALIDLFEDKGIDDTLITNCKTISLTTYGIIVVSVECDAEMRVFGKLIPLTETGATGTIDAIIAKKSVIEAYTYSLENIAEWYMPSSKDTRNYAPFDNGYVGQCSMNFDYSAIDTFYKFTATTLDELKALFVETTV